MKQERLDAFIETLCVIKEIPCKVRIRNDNGKLIIIVEGNEIDARKLPRKNK